MAADPNFEKHLHELEKSLGIPEGFIERLRDEDDWSFVIKAHALLEAAISQLLAHELGKPQLEGVFARLDMTAAFGKLTFGEVLDVVDKPKRRFIRALGEIRNDFAHQISNAGMKLDVYLAGMDKQKRKAKHEALDLIFATVESIKVHGVQRTPLEFFLAAPKIIIAASLGLVLVDIHGRTSVAKVSQDMRRSADALFTEFFMTSLGARKSVPGTLGSLAAAPTEDGQSAGPDEGNGGSGGPAAEG